VSDFLEELLHDEVPIIIRKKRGMVVDAWPHEDPENDPPIDSPPKEELYELRRWSGKKEIA